MEKIKELLKLAADSMKNNTLDKLLNNDSEYQEKSEEVRQALEKVKDLDLTKEQKNAIDILIAKKEETEYEHNINAYMAGILDGYELLKFFNLTNE